MVVHMYGPRPKHAYTMLVNASLSQLTLQVAVPLVRMEVCVVVLTSLTVTVSTGTQVPIARQKVYI